MCDLSIIMSFFWPLLFSDVLNQETRDKYNLNLLDTGYSTDYDNTINPTISVEFSTAAFRFGHSQVRSSCTKLCVLMSITQQIRGKIFR